VPRLKNAYKNLIKTIKAHREYSRLQCSSSKFSPFDFYFYLEELSDIFDKTYGDSSTTTKVAISMKNCHTSIPYFENLQKCKNRHFLT